MSVPYKLIVFDLSRKVSEAKAASLGERPGEGTLRDGLLFGSFVGIDGSTAGASSTTGTRLDDDDNRIDNILAEQETQTQEHKGAQTRRSELRTSSNPGARVIGARSAMSSKVRRSLKRMPGFQYHASVKSEGFGASTASKVRSRNPKGTFDQDRE
ncbi:MAG: hypothetical protein Q9223_001952 [Gallowayella weberi]